MVLSKGEGAADGTEATMVESATWGRGVASSALTARAGVGLGGA